MPITIRNKTVFHCKCLICGHEWDADKKPRRCAGCKNRGWNGEDYRFADPWEGVPQKSRIETGTEAPRLPRTESLVETFTKARELLERVVQENPCQHSIGACSCAEKSVIEEIDKQIAKLGGMLPRRDTFLVAR